MIQKGDYYILENDVEAIRLLTEKANELKRLPKNRILKSVWSERLRHGLAHGREPWKRLA